MGGWTKTGKVELLNLVADVQVVVSINVQIHIKTAAPTLCWLSLQKKKNPGESTEHESDCLQTLKYSFTF